MLPLFSPGVRPLQTRSSWHYQITRTMGPQLAAPPFPFPHAARQLQTRTNWHVEIRKGLATTGSPPQPYVPPRPQRRLQSREGWTIRLTRTSTPAPIPADIDVIEIPMEEPIAEFWDLPPYPRQQPMTYKAHLPGGSAAQFTANLYATAQSTPNLTNAIRMVSTSTEVRSFTPGTLVSSILMAADLVDSVHRTANLTTGIALTAALGDVRHLAIKSFQTQFAANLYGKVRKFTPDLDTNIPFAADLVMQTRQLFITLTAQIQFVSSAGSVSSLGAPLSTVPTFAANLTCATRQLFITLKTGIPLAADLTANATSSAALATAIPLLAALTSQAQTTPNLATGIVLAAAIGNLASLSTSLLSSLPAQMVAAMAAWAAATPSLTTGINLGSVPMRDVRDLRATLSALVPLSTSAADRVAMTAVLSTAVNLGTVPGVDAVQLVGALTNSPRLAANPSAQVLLQAALTTLIDLGSQSLDRWTCDGYPGWTCDGAPGFTCDGWVQIPDGSMASLLTGAIGAALGPSQSGTTNIVYAQALVTTVTAPAMIVYGIPID